VQSNGTHAATQQDPIGLRLRFQRQRRGFLARDVAVAADLSPSTLSLIENFVREPRPDELARLMAVLGMAE
jgi:transcriptional regulator with XRE-family HTH domain